jgi:hypothetical protein
LQTSRTPSDRGATIKLVNDRSQPAHKQAPAETRCEVFGKSYSEVLLFLKHEDDKINRVLTALAFLTAAAVTLYIFSRGTTSPETLELRRTDLTAADFFFGSYVLGLALALLAAIAALDPTSFYPRFVGAKGEPESILYYRAIGQDNLAQPSTGSRPSGPDWRATWRAERLSGLAEQSCSGFPS